MVYSLLTVPLSVAASQFGSRLLRLYLRDNTTQFILGLFVRTFVYLMSVAIGIPSELAQPEAPQLAASVGLLFSLISFGSIIVLVHHIGTSLQAPNMVASAGADLLSAIEVHNLDHIGAGLSTYVDEVTFQVSQYYDLNGRLRLIFDPITFTELVDAAFNMIRPSCRDNAEVQLVMLQAIETISSRITRPELRAELLRHVRLVEVECQAGRAIDWDKQRVSRRCSHLAAHLESSPAASSQFVVGL